MNFLIQLLFQEQMPDPLHGDIAGYLVRFLITMLGTQLTGIENILVIEDIVAFIGVMEHDF
jgi:hypothetical protein